MRTRVNLIGSDVIIHATTDHDKITGNLITGYIDIIKLSNYEDKIPVQQIQIVGKDNLMLLNYELQKIILNE